MSREVGFERASPGDRRARRAPLGLARRSAPVIAAVLLAAASACERRESAGEEPPARSWPPGTVIAIDGEAILAEEVDLPSAWIERIEPGSSSQHLRRLALTNVVIPRRIAGAIAGDEARERARAEALATLESLASGSPEAPATAGEPTSTEGDWLELGIVAWGTAMDLAEGRWSGVVEDVGRFVLLRRLGQDPAPIPGAIRVRLELIEFPYLAGVGRGALEQAYAQHRLEIVDPAWREIVPEHIQYKMGVHQP
jgi:hypothetical protein